MSDGNTTLAKRNRPRSVVRVLLLVGILFVFYVLLEGLAYRLWRENVISHQTYASVYAPILYLDHHWEWFSYWDDNYGNLWCNEGYYFLHAAGVELTKENTPHTFFTLQDLFSFGLATFVAVLGASLIYFPQWVYRVDRHEQLARDRKRDRIWGFTILTLGIVLLLFETRELLIYGF